LAIGPLRPRYSPTGEEKRGPNRGGLVLGALTESTKGEESLGGFGVEINDFKKRAHPAASPRRSLWVGGLTASRPRPYLFRGKSEGNLICGQKGKGRGNHTVILQCGGEGGSKAQSRPTIVGGVGSHKGGQTIKRGQVRKIKPLGTEKKGLQTKKELHWVRDQDQPSSE